MRSSRNRLGPARRTLCLLPAVCCLLWVTGCRQDMHNQPKIKAYREADFFADRRGMRPLPENTVARGFLNEDDHLFTGKVNGQFTDEFPFQVTRQVLQRGYRPPPSFHSEQIRKQTVGYWFDVMTNGFGAMQDYSAQVTVPDRWAIAAYIRVLQLSRSATVNDVPAERRGDLDRPADTQAPPAQENRQQ